MLYLLIGYMFLFIHRPFEVWSWLGPYRIERIYMCVSLLYWALLHGRKTWATNRLHYAFAFFGAVFLLAWLVSPFNTPRQQEVGEDYLKVVVFFFLVMSTVGDEVSLKRLLVGYLGVLGLYMTHSLREYFNGRQIYRMGFFR